MTTETLLRQGDVAHAALWVPDVGRAEEFYGSVLGWRYALGDGPHEREVLEARPPYRLQGGREHRTLVAGYTVGDVSEAVALVRQSGGWAGEPEPHPSGLAAFCTDDQGMPFVLCAEEGRPTGPPGPGGLDRLILQVPDAARARSFYGGLLDWEFVSETAEDRWIVYRDGADVRPVAEVWGGQERARIVPRYLVADIEAAVARVRAAGGAAIAPERTPAGLVAECVDDQGVHFHLYRPA